jgi:hypothetical protein
MDQRGGTQVVRNQKTVELSEPPDELGSIRVVPEPAMRFPEAYTARENERRLAYCVNRRRHNYVRTVSTALRTRILDGEPRHWRVEQSHIWCWDCGTPHKVIQSVDVAISEEEYRSLKTPVPTSYQGIAP